MDAPLPITDEIVTLGELPTSLGFILRLAQIRAFEHFFRAFEGSEVRPGEFTVLWVIGLNPGLRQGTLARTLHIKAAHMTKLVQRMVRDGLVRRMVPPEDRRSVRLSLSADGEAYLNRYRQNFLDVHTAEKVGLSDEERAQLLLLLGKIAFNEVPECL